MINVNAVFYQTTKRHNSTYRPVDSDTHITSEVVLKEATSVLYPTLSVISNLTSYNYVYLQEFSRYYFINDWTWANGLWWASCDVDVLASYRTAVYTYAGYCLRSYSDASGLIPDELAPKYQDVDINITAITSPWIANLNAGVFVVGIINNDVDAFGACSYYVLTAPQLQALKNQMMETSYIEPDSTFESVVGVSQQLFKALWNPIKYITSCMFFPIAGFGGGTEKPYLPMGWWQSSVTGTQILPTPYGSKLENIVIPKHPQYTANINYAYLKGSAYSRYILHFPPFQDIVLDSDLLIDENYIDIQLLIDPATGQGSLKVTPHDSNTVLAYTEAQIGVPMALAEISTDFTDIKTGAAGALLSQGANMLAKSSALSFLGNLKDTGESIISGIGEIATAGTTKLLSSGSNGSLAAYFNCAPQLQGIFTHVLPIHPSSMGYPCGAVKTLSTLTGFAMFYHPSVSLPAPGTASEADAINEILQTGVYCEW